MLTRIRTGKDNKLWIDTSKLVSIWGPELVKSTENNFKFGVKYGLAGLGLQIHLFMDEDAAKAFVETLVSLTRNRKPEKQFLNLRQKDDQTSQRVCEGE